MICLHPAPKSLIEWTEKKFDKYLGQDMTYRVTYGRWLCDKCKSEIKGKVIEHDRNENP